MVDASTREWLLNAASGSSLRALSLGLPRVVLAPAGPLPVAGLAERLRPHQRRLWRRRGALVLLRTCLLALIALLVMNGVQLAWIPDLPLSVRLVPAALVLLAGCWLTLAQRPTLLETARLLDHHFQLHDQIGTAVEVGASAPTAALAERQVTRAMALVDRMPRQAWAVPLFPVRARLLLLALLAGAALSALATPARQPHLAASATAAFRGEQRSGTAAAQHHLVARTGVAPASLAARAPTQRMPSSAHAASFAASFQARPGPQAAGAGSLAMSAAPSGPRAVPSSGTAATARAGTSSAAVSGAVSSGSGTGHQGSGTSGVAGSSQRAGAGNGTSQQTGSGQPGSAGQSGAQGNNALGAPQAAGNTGSQSSAGQGRRGQAKQSQQLAQTQNDNAHGTTSSNSANPFGQDTPSGSQGARTGSGGTATGQRTGAGATSGRNGATGRGAAGAARQGGQSPADGGPDQLGRRRGANVPTPQTHGMAPTRQAGAAGGPQIDLGGHSEIGTSGTGPQIVRIVPLNAGPGSAQAGTMSLGPGVAQGYVPEDDSQIPEAEQALIRAYFSYGSSG